MHSDIEGLELIAYVGRDESRQTEDVGLKQALAPAGLIPMVAVAAHRDRLERENIRAQFQAQANTFGRTIRLVRFVAVEVILTLDPGGAEPNDCRSLLPGPGRE
jgi:hypothetical protein